MTTDSRNNEFAGMTTQDKLIHFLMHAATREDIAKLDTKVDLGFTNARLETDAKFESLRSETREDIAKLDAKVDLGFANARVETDKKIESLRSEMHGLRSEMREDMAKLDTKLNKILYGLIFVVLVPIATQMIFQILKP